MTDLRQAAQQALDYWEQVAWGDAVMVDKMDTLRAALAQQAEPVEPVAWCSSVEFSDALKYAQSFNGWRRKYPKTDMPLYTAPPQRKPLTEEWVRSKCKETWVFETVMRWVRAVERAHGIGTEARATLTKPCGSLGEDVSLCRYPDCAGGQAGTICHNWCPGCR